jgi:hypothetical protein
MSSDAIALVALLLSVLFLFYSLPSGYWRADDPAILWHAMNSKGLSAFYSPSDWQKLSPNNLTPWIILSFKIDLWLAGLSPKIFYIHSIFSLASVVVAAYILQRQWISPIWVLLSTGLFLMGGSTASVTELLMTRHYLEGLLFALLSIVAFTKAIRQQKMFWAIAGAFAYALAATAKEIYVPLILVILTLPPFEGLKKRLRLAIPYLVVALLYILWRRYMLGAMIGGYSDADSLFSWQSVAGMASVVQRFPSFFFGEQWILPSSIFFIVVCIALFLNPIATPVFLSLAVGILVPLIPLIAFPGISGPDRYLFLPWFATCLAGVLSLQFVVSKLPLMPRLGQAVGIFAAALIILITFLYSNKLKDSRALTYREFDIQGRFYFAGTQTQALIPSPTLLHGYWYLTHLCDIKKVLAQTCPAVLIKGLPIAQPIEQLFKFDAAQGMMIDLSNKLPDERIKIETIDTSRALQADISNEHGLWRWSLGPYTKGQYYFVSPLIGRYPVPQSGILKTHWVKLELHVQYESPEGWSTSSPLLVVSSNNPIAWARIPKN